MQCLSSHLTVFMPQVYTCEQVLSYLRQFVSAEKASNVAEKKELEAPAPGMKLLAKKDDFTEDTLFAGMGGKKGKGARKAAEKQQKAADSVKVGARGTAQLVGVVDACVMQGRAGGLQLPFGVYEGCLVVTSAVAVHDNYPVMAAAYEGCELCLCSFACAASSAGM